MASAVKRAAVLAVLACAVFLSAIETAGAAYTIGMGSYGTLGRPSITAATVLFGRDATRSDYYVSSESTTASLSGLPSYQMMNLGGVSITSTTTAFVAAVENLASHRWSRDAVENPTSPVAFSSSYKAQTIGPYVNTVATGNLGYGPGTISAQDSVNSTVSVSAPYYQTGAAAYWIVGRRFSGGWSVFFFSGSAIYGKDRLSGVSTYTLANVATSSVEAFDLQAQAPFCMQQTGSVPQLRAASVEQYRSQGYRALTMDQANSLIGELNAVSPSDLLSVLPTRSEQYFIDSDFDENAANLDYSVVDTSTPGFSIIAPFKGSLDFVQERVEQLTGDLVGRFLWWFPAVANRGL